MAHVPEGLDPTIQSRDIVFEADVQSVTPFLKLATVSHNGSAHKTFALHATKGRPWEGSVRPQRRSCTSAPRWHSDS